MNREPKVLGGLKSLIMEVELPDQAQHIDALRLKEISQDAPIIALAYANIVVFIAALFCLAGLDPYTAILYVLTSYFILLIALLISAKVTITKTNVTQKRLIILAIFCNELILVLVLLFDFFAPQRANEIVAITTVVSISFISVSLCARFMVPFMLIKLLAIFSCCLFIYLNPIDSINLMPLLSVLSVCFLIIASIGYWMIKRSREEIWLRSKLVTLNQIADDRNMRLDRALIETETARQQAKEDYNLRQQLLSHIGHDLRQPVNAAGFILRELSLKVTQPENIDLVDNVNECVQSVRRMIEDIVQLTHYNNPNIEVIEDNIALESIFQQIIREYRGNATTKGYDIRYVPTRLNIKFDGILLTRIIRNLIQNAIKHANGDTILLGVRHRPDAVEIWVVDNGLGIQKNSSEAHPKPKSRLPSLGLGLKISTQLAIACGAKLSLISNPGHGTCGRLVIPNKGRRKSQAPE